MRDIIIHHSATANRRGVALLMVLFVVMAVTVISLGILARSNTELASGQNMALRIEMDQLAASGLAHARGLVLNPQEITSEYWTGGSELRLDGSSHDFYDVAVSLDESDPNVRCNYIIHCKAYRTSGPDEVGCSQLSATLRLDPCIALWTDAGTTVAPGLTINGDVRCGGSLTNDGNIDGDVFASGLTGTATGQLSPVGNLSLQWPSLSVADFTDLSPYTVYPLSNDTLSSDLGPDSPPHVFHRDGDLTVSDGVSVNGMLLVDGDLTIRGNGVTLTAGKNVPALYVTGDLIIEDVDDLAIAGLAAVDGDIRVSAGATGVSVVGGILVGGTLVETAPDSSGNHRDLVVYGAPTWRTDGTVELDGVDDKFEDASASSYLNGLDEITVAVWIKSDVTYRDRDILFTRNPTENDEELGLRYDGQGGHWPWPRSCIKASIRTTSGYTQIESSAEAQTTSWQHLALVWQAGDHLKLYINGNLNSLSYDGSSCSGSISGVEKLMVGLGTKNEYWDGLIGDLRIYDRALSGAQIHSLAHGTLTGLPDPIGHWGFNEHGMEAQITADPAKSAIVVGPDGNRTRWSPAAGAFFKAIEREP